jgi:hypothetical protein
VPHEYLVVGAKRSNIDAYDDLEMAGMSISMHKDTVLMVSVLSCVT